MRGVKKLRRLSPKTRSVYRAGRRHKKEAYSSSFVEGCAKKVAFKNLSAAENFIEKHFPEQYTLEPYRCKFCRKFHIGNRRERKRREYRSSPHRG